MQHNILRRITTISNPKTKILYQIPKSTNMQQYIMLSQDSGERSEDLGYDRPAFAAEGLCCTKRVSYTIPTDLEKFGELYETPLSGENPTYKQSLHIHT